MTKSTYIDTPWRWVNTTYKSFVGESFILLSVYYIHKIHRYVGLSFIWQMESYTHPGFINRGKLLHVWAYAFYAEILNGNNTST